MNYIFLFLGLVSSLFGVVTVAPVEIGSVPGTSGGIEASIQNTRGNTNKDEYKGGLRVQYDNNSSYVLWGEISANYAEVDQTENTNKAYSHLRYIHTLFESQDINYELFAQLQKDKFTKVKERFLGGGGYRFHILRQLIGQVYFGIGAFYEHVAYTTTVDPTEKNIRGNLYISYTNEFSHDAKLSYVGYYQPELKRFKDSIVTNTLELQVYIYRKLAISFKMNYNYDVKPAMGVSKEDFTQTTSFIYKF